MQYFKDTANLLWETYFFVLSDQCDIKDVRRWINIVNSVLDSVHAFTRKKLSCYDKKKLQMSVAIIRSV